jgi:hypothetical protein
MMPMKRTNTIQGFLLATLLATSASLTEAEANTSTNAAPASLRSVFTLPAGARDGRDPFYPSTTRALGEASQSSGASAQTSTNSSASGQPVEIASLKFPGVSGTPGNLLAIINNHTFAVGEEGEVLTPNGKVQLRCLEIHPDVVVVEIAGKIHRINLESQ